ncbi:MAG: YggT family protein, partial [Chloroflexota bacterium]
MTYQEPRDADTVVERERYVEREPVQPAGSQVNVNADGGGYARAVDSGPGPLYYVRRIVILLFGILTVLIALRIILLLLGANAGNGLVDFVYGATEPFVAPFRGIFSF